MASSANVEIKVDAESPRPLRAERNSITNTPVKTASNESITKLNARNRLSSKSDDSLFKPIRFRHTGSFHASFKRGSRRGSRKQSGIASPNKPTSSPRSEQSLPTNGEELTPRHSFDLADYLHSVSFEDPFEQDWEVSKLQAKNPVTIHSSYFVLKPLFHMFQYSSSKRFCNVKGCRRRTGFSPSLVCSVCKFSVHERCLSLVTTPCQCCHTLFKGSFAPDIVPIVQSQVVNHHWVEGNYNDKCSQCHKHVGKMSTKLKEACESRCSLCKKVVHAACLKDESTGCDLGEFAGLRLSPGEVFVDMYLSKDPNDPITPKKADASSSSEVATPPPTNTGSSNGELQPGVVVGGSTPNLNREKEKEKEKDKEKEKAKRTASQSCDVPLGKTESVVSLVPDTPLLPHHLKIIPKKDSTPLLIFVNPKSGGNQGLKLLRKFQSLFNPWQVFDIIQCGGPEFALTVFRDVPNFRILVCGGDGTVGWVMSGLDKFDINPVPSIAVVPLGTGNDLAQVLRWGNEYSNQDLKALVHQVQEATTFELDRWSLTSTLIDPKEEWAPGTSLKPPLDVINNYFSFGVDANTVLAFHLAREKDPNKFTSRIGNKIYYGYAGGKQLFQRGKSLSSMCTLVCDGVDFANDLKRLQGIIFLNITSYAGGVNPWGRSKDKKFTAQSASDGLIEVIGIESVGQLARHMAGLNSCVRLCQCKSASITTQRPMAMQIDGEPCFLAPSALEITYRNQKSMLQRKKGKEDNRHSRSNIP